MGFISNKKVKGVVSSSLVLSAVAPQVVGAQNGVIDKVRSGINYAKLSIVHLFYRTIWFWIFRKVVMKKVMKNLKNKLKEQKNELFKDFDNLSKSIKEALEKLGMQAPIDFTVEGIKKINVFLQEKVKEEEPRAEELSESLSNIIRCQRFFAALVALTNLKNACYQGNKQKYNEVINSKEGKDIYELLRDCADNVFAKEFRFGGNVKFFKEIINKDVYSKGDFDLKAAGKALAEDFIPKLEEKALSLAKERGYIDKDFQYSEDKLEQIVEELSKYWQRADKKYNEWYEKVGTFLRSVTAYMKYLPTEIKKFEFLKKLDLDGDEINGLLEDENGLSWKERNFNSNLKKLKDFKEGDHTIYYNGDLSLLSQQG